MTPSPLKDVVGLDTRLLYQIFFTGNFIMKVTKANFSFPGCPYPSTHPIPQKQAKWHQERVCTSYLGRISQYYGLIIHDQCRLYHPLWELLLKIRCSLPFPGFFLCSWPFLHLMLLCWPCIEVSPVIEDIQLIKNQRSLTTLINDHLLTVEKEIILWVLGGLQDNNLKWRAGEWSDGVSSGSKSKKSWQANSPICFFQ